MPLISHTQLRTRKANTVMSAAFFPRMRKNFLPLLAGNYKTTSLVEPHAIGGSAPPMARFKGNMRAKAMRSWKIEVPNLLYKNIENIDRTELEADQTRTLIKQLPQFGVRLAQLPDRILLSRIIKGHTAGSATELFEGTSYSTTIDGLPYFHGAHTTYGGATQSNLISTSLPATAAAVRAQDIPTTVYQLQTGFNAVMETIKQVKDDKGEHLWPEFETKESVVLMFPSCLEYYATLAFKATGSIIGGATTSGTGSNGSTTNISPMFVKDVIFSGRLGSMIDPDTDASISASGETCWYAFVVDDYVRPFYQSLFAPPGPGDLFPKDYNIEAEANEMIRRGGGSVTKDQAALWAGSIVEHNLNASGENATRDVVENEYHFISSRSRTNIAYGPWFTGYKVLPTAVSS